MKKKKNNNMVVYVTKIFQTVNKEKMVEYRKKQKRFIIITRKYFNL